MNFKTVVLTFAALAASSSLAAAFYGSGGVVTRDGDYVIHTFTNANDTFTVKGSGKIDVLLVGGGGGGGTGRAGAGGGGGGGVVYVQNVDVTEQSYEVLVGEGGASGKTGGDTVAFALTAHGGGGGGASSSTTATGPSSGFGKTGGCGGGAGPIPHSKGVEFHVPGAAGIDGEGFSGGSATNTVSAARTFGGGGGGAGGPGGNARTGQAGAGGIGRQCAITGANVYYGGGGGGGQCDTSGSGKWNVAGGMGGGGRGSSAITKFQAEGEPGTDGLGGGGGGAGNYAASGLSGGKGGCGVVIVRYKPVHTEYFSGVQITEGTYSYERKRIDGVKYGIYTITNNATVTLSGAGGMADVLLVGGGAGGGAYRGGGGAGGEVVQSVGTGCGLIGGTYEVVIGEGGAGGACKGNTPDFESNGGDGGDTTAFGFTAQGGSGGGTMGKGIDGFLGGGAGAGSASVTSSSDEVRAGGVGTLFSGGASFRQGAGEHQGSNGGGGAGAGGSGQDASRTNEVGEVVARHNGAGGIGVMSSITGESLGYGGGGFGGRGDLNTCTGDRTYGGGRGGHGTSEKVEGQSDPVRSGTAGQDGMDGRGGGGGGGGGYVRGFGNGGKGGSGVVILRVQEEPKGLLLLFR